MTKCFSIQHSAFSIGPCPPSSTRRRGATPRAGGRRGRNGNGSTSSTYKTTGNCPTLCTMQDKSNGSSALRSLARDARNSRQTRRQQQAAARKFSSMLDLVNNELPPDRGECLKLFAKRRNKKQVPTFSLSFEDGADEGSGGGDSVVEVEEGDENSVLGALEALRREQVKQQRSSSLARSSSSSSSSSSSRAKRSRLPALGAGGAAAGGKRWKAANMESTAALKRLKSQGCGLGAFFLLGAPDEQKGL